MTDAVRTAAQRKADTITRLEGDADVWVATASATPRTMRAWNSLAEINGRTIMRDGQWTPA
jgi:hypothetical protein